MTNDDMIKTIEYDFCGDILTIEYTLYDIENSSDNQDGVYPWYASTTGKVIAVNGESIDDNTAADYCPVIEWELWEIGGDWEIKVGV